MHNISIYMYIYIYVYIHMYTHIRTDIYIYIIYSCVNRYNYIEFKCADMFVNFESALAQQNYLQNNLAE